MRAVLACLLLAAAPPARAALAYVTNQHGGTLSVFDGAFAPLPDIPVGDYPEGIAMSADGARAYVAVWMDNRLAEIDVAAGRVLRKIKVGESPRAFGGLPGAPATGAPSPAVTPIAKGNTP